MRILVLQHAKVEHPGFFRQLLEEDGHVFDSVELFKGSSIPLLDNYDGLWVLGGPMDVWEEKQYPWLVEEKRFIRDSVVHKGIPYLGLCLGHQHLAEVLGGTVKPATNPEIGVLDVHLTEEGASGIFLDGLPESFKCLQWHSAEVAVLPANCNVLATSKDCKVQALRWGTRAHSVQFHLETESDTIYQWSNIPEYAKSLQAALGDEGTALLSSACSAEISNFNKNAERVYLNWMQTAARA